MESQNTPNANGGWMRCFAQRLVLNAFRVNLHLQKFAPQDFWLEIINPDGPRRILSIRYNGETYEKSLPESICFYDSFRGLRALALDLLGDYEIEFVFDSQSGKGAAQRKEEAKQNREKRKPPRVYTRAEPTNESVEPAQVGQKPTRGETVRKGPVRTNPAKVVVDFTATPLGPVSSAASSHGVRAPRNSSPERRSMFSS